MTAGYDSDLAKKMNIKRGMTVRVVARPAEVDLPGLNIVEAGEADAVVVFVRTVAEADARAATVVDATVAGMVTWVAYPKAKQLGTDLNRDILFARLREHGVDAVRQVAIDATWSAMRFTGLRTKA